MKHFTTHKKTALLLAGILLATSLCACGSKEETTTIRIGAMAGPTAMGLVGLFDEAANNTAKNEYAVSDLATDATAMVTPFVKGEIDIAAVPSNLAANLYQKTEGDTVVLASCALGVLSLVSTDETVTGITDLGGRTVYATGQGAVPEMTIRYLLNQVGTDDTSVDFVWCSDTTEALSYIQSVPGATAILPQPFVTVALTKVEGLRVVEDLNEKWNEVCPESGIVTGVLIARRSFVEKYPEQVATFIEEYKASVAFLEENPEEASQLIADYGIVPAAAIAQKALPGCHIKALCGEELKTVLGGFLEVLYSYNPDSVGGALPAEDFYYMGAK